MIWLLPLSALLAAGGHFIFLHYVYHIDLTLAACDSIISVLTLSLALWALGLAIKYYPTNVSVTLYSLLIAIFFSFSTVFASTALTRWWTETTDSNYLYFLEHSGPVRYIIYWLLCSWVSTYLSMSKRINTQEQKFKQQADATALLKEAELFKLRQQLQPHFLYNSLNSISALTMIEPAKAQEMIGLLSDFLRNSVQRETQQKVSLKDELDYLDKYLAIESIRFGNRLQVIKSDATDINAFIPPFLLQPLIENAIKFGLYGNTGSVSIGVHIGIKDGLLEIAITNPYNEAETEAPRGTGFGLAGVLRRLQLLYARADLLATKKDNGIFTTTLKIPQDV